MFLRKLTSTAGVVLLVGLVLGAGLFLGSGLAQGPGGHPERPARADDKPKPADAGKEGRIYYHLNAGLTTVQPDGEKSRDLAPLEVGDLMGYQVLTDRLSPDGTRLAFGKSVFKDANGQNGIHPPEAIYVRDVSKSNAAEEVVKMEGVEIHNFCWSPDGARLAFVSWEKDVVRNWVVDLKTKKVEEVKLPKYKADGKELSMSVAAWAPDGKSFLVRGDGLHTVKTDGTGLKDVIKEQKGIFSGSCQFSPDGRKVLFVVMHQGESTTLHVADVAGGQEKALVDAKNFTDMHACWSPDGRRVAYSFTPLDADGKREGETSLFVVDADGQNTVRLLTEKHAPGTIRLRLVDWR